MTALTHPMDTPDTNWPAVRCRGTNRRGTQCGRHAVPGAAVCRMHGGAAPQVQRKAALRLAALVDPAIATLAREMTNQTTGSAMSRLRAAENVLDRAGYPRRLETDAGTARELLAARLIEIAAERSAEQAQSASEDRERRRQQRAARRERASQLTIEGETVPDDHDRGAPE